MPSADLWALFPALGVVVLVLIAVGIGGKAVWREVKLFINEQDLARSKERQTQRLWEEEQEKLREARWQSFFTGMQLEQARENEEGRKSISNLADVIQGMKSALETLTITLRNHIIEDDARFAVLLDEAQKASVDVKTRPRKDK